MLQWTADRDIVQPTSHNLLLSHNALSSKSIFILIYSFTLQYIFTGRQSKYTWYKQDVQEACVVPAQDDTHCPPKTCGTCVVHMYGTMCSAHMWCTVHMLVRKLLCKSSAFAWKLFYYCNITQGLVFNKQTMFSNFLHIPKTLCCKQDWFFF